MRTPLAPLALAAALVAAGCADKAQDSVEIVGLCALPDDCKFNSGGCSDFYLGRPVVDVALASSLQVVLDVRSQVTPNPNTGSGGTNTHDAQIQTASISYDFVNAPTGLGGTTMQTVGHVPAGKESVVVVDLVTEEAMTRLKGLSVPAFNAAVPNYWDVVANVTLKGVYQDNSKFETGTFSQTFRVCNGCLPACPGIVTCPPGGEGQTPAICN